MPSQRHFQSDCRCRSLRCLLGTMWFPLENLSPFVFTVFVGTLGATFECRATDGVLLLCPVTNWRTRPR